MNAALLLLSILPAAWSASPPAIPWKQFDEPQSWCVQTVGIRLPDDTFFRISNDLPGRDAYNDIVQDFRAERFGRVDGAVQDFSHHFPASELMEPLTFLDVTAAARRAATGQSPLREAEQKLRTAMLLFPKSAYAPTTIAELAGAFVAREDFPRALAAYLSLEADFPDHPLRCLFSAGVADLNFRVGATGEGIKQLDRIRQRCHDSASQSFAIVRAAEIAMYRGEKKAPEQLEKLWVTHNSWIEREYPVFLFNLGEGFYRAGRYADARNFFARYLEATPASRSCHVEAQKRIADADFFAAKPTEVAFGEYLAAHELDSTGDLGRYCRAHALLITYGAQSKIEKARRHRELAEIVGSMHGDRFRQRLETERALVLSEDGEPSALAVLENVRRGANGATALKNPQVAQFLKDAWLRHFRERVNGPDEDLPGTIAALTKMYPIWIEGSVHEPTAKDWVRRLVLKEFDARMKKGDYAGALATLETWSGSIFKQVPPGKETMATIVESILRQTEVDPKAEAKGEAFPLDLSLALANQSDRWAAFLTPDYAALLAYAHLTTGNEVPFRALVSALETKFPDFLALNQDARATLFFLLASGLRTVQKYPLAERALAAIPDGGRKDSYREFQYQVLVSKGELDSAFKVGLALAKAPKGGREAWFARLLTLVHEGRLWPQAATLLGEARRTPSLQSAPAGIAPYEFLAARASVELGDCPKAIDLYRAGLKHGKNNPEAPEARFRLGKCLLQTRHNAEGRTELETLVKAQDAFWSPLARNELQLLRKK